MKRSEQDRLRATLHDHVLRDAGYGVEEAPNAAVRTANPMPTVIRGVLFLAEAPSHVPQSSSWLLDAAGRKVADLHPSANDVHALAPSVYFVRKEPRASSNKPQAVWEIVIAKR